MKQHDVTLNNRAGSKCDGKSEGRSERDESEATEIGH